MEFSSEGRIIGGGSGIGKIYWVISGQVYCGDTLQGDFMYTLNYTDANLYWVCCRAQWNKGEVATLESLQYIKNTLPFNLISVHPDSGTEFINYHMKGWADRVGVKMHRSRPDKKNDNMYVEERNGHVVRKFLGYGRYDKFELVALVNKYYEYLNVYLNFFVPVRRTLSKEKVNSKYIRTYEKISKTPYQRLQESDLVSEETKYKRKVQYEEINLFDLKLKLDKLEKEIKQILASR